MGLDSENDDYNKEREEDLREWSNEVKTSH